MSSENLNNENLVFDADENIELSEEQLEKITGGVSAGKTKKLVCDACQYTIAATVSGIQTMVKHCKSKHKNATYHVE